MGAEGKIEYFGVAAPTPLPRRVSTVRWPRRDESASLRVPSGCQSVPARADTICPVSSPAWLLAMATSLSTGLRPAYETSQKLSVTTRRDTNAGDTPCGGRRTEVLAVQRGAE